jgi:hypothetical protein
VIACGSIAALILATAYAPLFHVHTDGSGAPLIHAHFPELETADDERVVHMESNHSHSEARPIDILTTTGPTVAHFDAVILSAFIVPIAAQVCCGFVAHDRPRAHAPPEFRPHIPRAPPA